MLVHRRVTPSSICAGTHLYTWVERGTMRVKYLAQEHNTVPRRGLEPGPPDPESSALTIRPPRLNWYIHQNAFVRTAAYYRKIHYLTREFHVKFHAKNRYRTNREAMSAISVFQVKFNVEFTSQVMDFP